MLTCLAAFNPIRLIPLEDMTVGSVNNPVEKSDSFVSLQISGFKHQGKNISLEGNVHQTMLFFRLH